MNPRSLSRAGQFLYDFPGLSGVLAPGPLAAYLFSRPLNRLEFDPTYPRNPRTLGDYIRKWRMEQGLLIRELASALGVREDTVTDWEKNRRVPRNQKQIRALREGIPEVGRWLEHQYHFPR